MEKKQLKRENVYFNWGAFCVPVIYALWHKLYFWAILSLIPYANLVVDIIFGFKANELAWEQEKYKTEEEFAAAQKKWNDFGIVFAYACLAICVIIVFFIITL